MKVSRFLLYHTTFSVPMSSHTYKNVKLWAVTYDEYLLLASLGGHIIIHYHDEICINKQLLPFQAHNRHHEQKINPRKYLQFIYVCIILVKFTAAIIIFVSVGRICMDMYYKTKIVGWECLMHGNLFSGCLILFLFSKTENTIRHIRSAQLGLAICRVCRLLVTR